MGRLTVVRSGFHRVLSWPALHFLTLGGLLYLASQVWTPWGATPDHLVFEEVAIEEVRRNWQVRHGRLPTPAEEKELVDVMIDDELLFREARRLSLDQGDLVVHRRLLAKMSLLADDAESSPTALYQEALALGLDRDDPIVRQRLIQKMRLLAQAEGGPIRPSEAEMQEYLARHQEQFRRPERVLLSQVFLSRERHGDRLIQDAGNLGAKLRTLQPNPEQAISLGDPFILAPDRSLKTAEQLARVFGPGFAEGVMTLEPGTWSEPVESAYGLHLVWIHEKVPSRDALLDEVRKQVLQGFAAERRKQRVETLLRRLRQGTSIQIEQPAAQLAENRTEVG